MSDKLENFIKNNRGNFDTQAPGNEVWQSIQAGISQQAAAGASAASSGAAAGKAGAAKLAAAWKIAAVAAAVAVVGAGAYFLSSGEKEGGQQSPIGPTPQTAQEVQATQKVELQAGNHPLVFPPKPEADIPYLQYVVDAAKGGEYRTPTGTEIIIQPGIFVDAQGQPVDGEVTLLYREFHDAADIILSGIPMTYNHDGKTENFQTAGMMEIRGKKGDQEVFIAPGKEISFNMASFTDEADYNFYRLDEKEGWKDYGDRPKLRKNKKREEGMKLIAQKPKPPVKGKANQEVDQEVTFGGDYEQFEELKPFRKVRWQAASPKEYSAVESKLMGTAWNKVELEEVSAEELLYNIHLTNRRSEKVTIKVRPVVEGEDYDKAMARFKKKMEDYEKLLSQKELDEDRLRREATLQRSFSVAGFGYYNCDRFYNMPDAVTILPSYNFGEDVYANLEQARVYHITGNNRALMVLDPRSKVIYSSRDENHLVVLIPGGKIAHFDDSQFRKLTVRDRNAVATTSKVQIDFQIKDHDVRNAADLRQVLGI